MKDLDEKINNVYKFILDFTEQNSFPPSIRDICAKCDIKSTATAYLYIEKLKEKGLIDKSPLKKRSITISTKTTFKSIPLIGTVRAGTPIFAVENLEGYVPLPSEFDKNDNEFALKVKGNSMIDADIKENDIIIVKVQNTAQNGDIVVALIDDSATVKRFYKKDNKIILHPENSELPDIILDKVEILGLVKGLIRKF